MDAVHDIARDAEALGGNPDTSRDSGVADPLGGTTAGESTRTGTAGSASPTFTLGRVTWLVLLLLVAQYVVPYLLERYQFSATRGRERALYETASAGMEGLQLSTLSKACRLVSHRVGPSVVHIDVSPVRATRGSGDGFSPPFGSRGPAEPSQGSGVIVDGEGYIVTNNHVIDGAAGIRVALSDGRVLPARVVGQDSATDLSVLKIEADGLITAEWGDSDRIDVGDLVWAVGSPFGLQRTVTFGIVSGKHRSGMAGAAYQDFLQTDAAVNPGNSGGPLVDAEGRVVGINTAIVGDAYQGISFAIPSSVAREICERLKAKGQVDRGWLGVRLREVTEDEARTLGLDRLVGTVVEQVVDEPGTPSPAREIGLQPGDVIVRWNEQPVERPTELMRMIAMTQIGSTASIEFLRRGERVRRELTVAARPLE